MKGSNAKSASSNMFDIGSCGLPQDVDESIIDDQLSVSLDRELSNTANSKVQKMLKIKSFIYYQDMNCKEGSMQHAMASP